MGHKADDDLDYNVVKGKVRKRDKDGNDISTDKLGPGGRRREDGTLSAQVYDLELVEETDDCEQDDIDARLQEYALEERRLRAEREENAQATVDFIFAIIEAAIEYLEAHPEVTVKIVDGVVSFGKNVAGRFHTLKAKLTPRALPKKSQSKATAPAQKPAPSTAVQPKPLPDAVPSMETEQKKRATMSIEQARLEVLQILGHYIEIKKGLQRLSDCDYIELQKLGFEGVIARLEGIVQQYPAFMDESIEASILQFSLDEFERTRVRETLLAHPSDRIGR